MLINVQGCWRLFASVYQWQLLAMLNLIDTPVRIAIAYVVNYMGGCGSSYAMAKVRKPYVVFAGTSGNLAVLPRLFQTSDSEDKWMP